MHIGGLRTALYNYLYARKNGGNFLLRIEDTDLKRNSKEATKAIIEAFKWCGLEHDGEVTYQSERFDLYFKKSSEGDSLAKFLIKAFISSSSSKFSSLLTSSWINASLKSLSHCFIVMHFSPSF